MTPTLLRPSPGRLAERLASVRQGVLTYGPVLGSTRDRLPEGWRHLDQAVVVGTGRLAFDRLSSALVSWDLHREARMALATTNPHAVVGCVVVNVASFGPVGVVGPCRVVAVVDEPHRRGFAYGTLPGHPLRGEEQFTAELDAEGRLRFRIRSFSRPAGLAGLLPPVAAAGQRLVNRRYRAAARRIAA